MRTKRANKKILDSDPIYKSRLVTKMINMLMVDGKKSIARSFLYEVLNKLSEDKKDATSIFEEAVKNVMPVQEVRSRRVGGATYQVPMPVKHDRSEAMALRWIIESARKKSGKNIVERLYDEIKNAHEGLGEAMKKREETHKNIS